MKLFQICFFIISLLFISSSYFSMVFANEIDFYEAYILALKNDKIYESARHEKDVFEALADQSSASILPQVYASSNVNRYKFFDAPSYYTDYLSHNHSINLRQPLFNLQKLSEYTQGAIRRDIGSYRLNIAEKTLVTRLSEAYFNLLISKNNLTVIEEEKKAILEQFEQTKKLFQSGETTITDIHEIEARYYDILSREVEVLNSIEINQKALSKIIGIDALKIADIDSSIEVFSTYKEDYNYWQQIAFQISPIIKYHENNVRLNKEEITKSKGSYYPTLDFVMAYTNTNTSDYRKTDSTGYGTIGLQLNLLIYGGGYVAGKVKETKARYEQSKAEYENAKIEVSQRVNDALLGIKGAISKIKSLEIAYKSSQVSLESVKKSFNAGIRTSVDILNSIKDLYSIKSRLNNAKYEYLLNLIRLKSDSGVINSEDILHINKFFKKSL